MKLIVRANLSTLILVGAARLFMVPLLFVLSIQRSTAQDFCGQVLAGGIWDISASASESSRLKSFTNWFCSQDFTNEGSFKKAAADLKAPINNVPVEFKGQSASKNWKNYYSAACSFRDEFTSEYSKDQYYSKVANKDVLDAWTTCTAKGAFLTTRYTADKNSVVFELKFESDEIGNTTPLNVSELKVAQAKQGGGFAPVACDVFGGKGIDFDLAKGLAVNFAVHDKAEVKFVCTRNPCLVTHVGVTADRKLRPSPFIEIPSSRCDGDSLIENCVKQDKNGHCLKCEFDIDEGNRGKGSSIFRKCTKMTPGGEYEASIDVNVSHSTGEGGSNCWDTPVLVGPSGKNGVAFDNSGSCTYSSQKITGFQIPQIDGLGTAEVQIMRCSKGKDTSDCHFKGKLQIYSKEGM